jgi:HK97 family phage portal protein
MAPTYNGSRPTLRDRARSLLGVFGRAEFKDAPYPVMSEYGAGYDNVARWKERNALNYIREGYKKNAAVFSCVRTWASYFVEAPLVCYTDETRKKQIPDHPLRLLIQRPNEIMGEREFMKLFVAYGAIGGNSYGRLVPYKNRAGVAEIWPYSAVNTWPVPRGNKWIDHYEYSVDEGLHKEPIDPREIIHYKWEPDLEYPWKGMSALEAVSQQVDTDAELVRYIKVVLQNDAVVRGVLTLPSAARPLNEQQLQQMKKEWKLYQGGGNRGNIPILQGGLEFKKTSLDLNELAADALKGMTQVDIAAAFGVPALIAGLLVGLENGREGNWESTRKQFTEGALAARWADVASEFQQSLVPLMGNDCVVGFDLSKVQALAYLKKEQQEAARAAWEAQIPVSINEVRAVHGFEPIAGMDKTYAFKGGKDAIVLVPDLKAYIDTQDTMQQHQLAQSEAATEAAQLQNEAASSQLEAAGGDEGEQESEGEDTGEGEGGAGVDNVVPYGEESAGGGK